MGLACPQTSLRSYPLGSLGILEDGGDVVEPFDEVLIGKYVFCVVGEALVRAVEEVCDHVFEELDEVGVEGIGSKENSNHLEEGGPLLRSKMRLDWILYAFSFLVVGTSCPSNRINFKK